jgi:uncharacterized phiE125 gp8 family phage protein
MAHRLTTAAAVPVVTASVARQQCRIDGSDNDEDLERLIGAATIHCEKICKRAFITQTWTLTMDGWCDRRYWCSEVGMIYVPRPPLIAVSSIAYIDSNGTSQTLATDQYRVDAANEPGRIEPAYSVSWPSLRPISGNVTITHTAGYGAAATSVPDDIKHAILLLVGHWNENREGVLVGSISKHVEHAVLDLLDPYVMEVYA